MTSTNTTSSEILGVLFPAAADGRMPQTSEPVRGKNEKEAPKLTNELLNKTLCNDDIVLYLQKQSREVVWNTEEGPVSVREDVVGDIMDSK